MRATWVAWAETAAHWGLSRSGSARVWSEAREMPIVMKALWLYRELCEARGVDDVQIEDGSEGDRSDHFVGESRRGGRLVIVKACTLRVCCVVSCNRCEV